METAPARGPFAPTDGASLAAVRIGFGVILLGEAIRFLLADWVGEYWTGPAFHFTFLGFGWVKPLPGAGTTLEVCGLGLAAALLALGLWTRWSALAFFLGFTHLFLIDKARYLNHFYLVVLLAFLLVFLPSNRAFSLDARRRSRSPLVPAWSLSLLRFQVGLVYFYAGVAKLNADWLQGWPLRMWLEERSGRHPLGGLLETEGAALLVSYGGLLLDLLAWPLLAWKRTRFHAFLVVVAFHLTNKSLFGIGIFPWLMIAATTVFFPPDWPRRLLRLPPVPSEAVLPAPSAPRRRWILGLAGLYAAVQVLVPLRHFLYPGSVHWTEEGHLFSWHMKLRSKRSEAFFLVSDPDSGESWVVDPRAELREWQVETMDGRPDMILEYAHHLAESKRAEGHRRVEVRAEVRTSLNGRPPQALVDPSVDLAAERRGFAPYRWILPLVEGRGTGGRPLRRPR
jgi:vitamin K-dependent gamma-carboxylase-like protein